MQTPTEITEQLPPPLQEAFLQFLGTTNPSELRQHLTGILFEYMIDRHDNLPENFNNTLEDLYNLFILLETSGKHADQWHAEAS
jgi:hypothetical protein